MFGYVKICKPQLKVCEYDTYKAMYCTLCKRMGKKYGVLMRMTLNYDFAFFALLGISVKGLSCTFEKKQCVCNPFKKCNYCCGAEEIIDYAADVSVLMTYYSVVDKIADETGIRRLFYKLFRRLIHKKFIKATTQYPQIYDIVKSYSHRQFMVEQKDSSMDEASEPTAIALAEIFKNLSSAQEEQRILHRMGYCTGKWIYLADAMDDLDDDIKKGRFNPLRGKSMTDVIGTMNVCSTDAGISFELFQNRNYDTIIKNIYYLGMPNVIKSIQRKREKSK